MWPSTKMFVRAIEQNRYKRIHRGTLRQENNVGDLGKAHQSLVAVSKAI